MSDQKKPREFWLVKHQSHFQNNLSGLTIIESYEARTEKPPLGPIYLGEVIHVREVTQETKPKIDLGPQEFVHFNKLTGHDTHGGYSKKDDIYTVVIDGRYDYEKSEGLKFEQPLKAGSTLVGLKWITRKGPIAQVTQPSENAISKVFDEKWVRENTVHIINYNIANKKITELEAEIQAYQIGSSIEAKKADRLRAENAELKSELSKKDEAIGVLTKALQWYAGFEIKYKWEGIVSPNTPFSQYVGHTSEPVSAAKAALEKAAALLGEASELSRMKWAEEDLKNINSFVMILKKDDSDGSK